ncbi:carboxyphosphonoenolpyruvate phosphonomutase protein [Rutstroemia sp. NJR-2017a WRK4]|nr:carboxyphosphonoenolpyruvate phosphonomutase protein [Rutstroemia sp. NJR-2017a WRK4]
MVANTLWSAKNSPLSAVASAIVEVGIIRWFNLIAYQDTRTQAHDRTSHHLDYANSPTKALATASYAVAAARGTTDAYLDLETNLSAIPDIAAVAKQFNKPLTVDIQDGYGDSLERAITALIDFGVVGVNLEDCGKDGELYSIETAVERINRTLLVAKSKGVPDFVVNARCDVLVQGGKLDEVLDRGKQYLAAGATAVFVWGGSSRGVSSQEVRMMVKEFDGHLNVLLSGKPDALTIPQIRELGVGRISIGPALQVKVMKTLTQEAEKLLTA